ncbi:carbohydrate kinase [Actinocatenispora thailandica]|uniref:Carbohydrate kinase n=1 Tax=Actinocatenispora thailandica TaxID=227318 RepID=A0A7R7HW93_9ACTN|nr:FGGY-family carbohydrate kinase [Actinocatenispora thailandica]BCJ33739.1 carbohydrate kinase [Actinocatenispora thailandica]
MRLTGRYLGIDLGTSVAKLALFTECGDLVATAARSVPLEHPAPGRVEQDASLIVDAVRDLGRELCPDPDALALVAITGQGDGCWLTDRSGHPVRPAISWLDGRAAGILADWNRAGIAEAVYRINGNTMFPGALGPLLYWLDEHEPASLARAETAGYCKDMLFTRLTGDRATDPSDSSLPFGDHAGGYSAEALDLCGLAHRADLLAPVVTPLPVGTVHPAGAAAVGLPAGTPVTNGPFDLPACAIGGGVREPGDGLLTLGTTLACQVLVESVDAAGEPAGMHLATGTPGRWLRAMPAMVGTASLDWALNLVGLSHADLDGVLRSTEPGAHGVEMLPYLAPSGERAPFVDPAARGQLTGISLTTTREDLVRALCEGLAFAARQCLTAAGLDGRLVVCGGGTRSLPWLEIFASVLGRPIEVAGAEVGARGAILAGLAAVGGAEATPDTKTWTAPVRVVDPDPTAARHYEYAYQRYLAHQSAARSLWPRPPR